jgi:hypothetical protein
MEKGPSASKPLRITACAYLRCKKDFYIPPTEEPEEETLTPQDYWCGQTLSPFGPDEEIADLKTCQPGRACHRTVVHTSE